MCCGCNHDFDFGCVSGDELDCNVWNHKIDYHVLWMEF